MPYKGRYARLSYEDFYALSDFPELSIGAGGSVANSLRDLGRLGAKCAFIGKTGCDREGEYFRYSLQDCGVEAVLSVVPGGRSGSCAVWHNEKWRGFAAKPDVKIVNANGVGDAFAAGFIRGLLGDSEIEECVSPGNEIAAAVLSSAESYLLR
ncbi:MAG: PfkB family carbohydrate kinase [Alphaproteobacteria bacterium]|nr:PfkB family carbohydrate kinase [Alphaproteobacteria bacterium]